MNKRRSGNGGNQTNNHKQTPQQTSNYPSTNQSHPTQARSLWSVMRSFLKYYHHIIIFLLLFLIIIMMIIVIIILL